MSFKKLLAVGVAFAGWSGMLLRAPGATIYTNETDLVAAISGFPVFVNDFTNPADVGQWVVAHPVAAANPGLGS